MAAPGVITDELAQFTADLIGDRKCELARTDKGGTLCGGPAAMRLPVSCWMCGIKDLVWICEDCHENIWKPHNGELTCSECLRITLP